MKLHLILPMGGGGTRFGVQKFQAPKPLIEIYGKPFFYWAVQSVRKFVDLGSLTFVVLKDHVDRFSIREQLHAYYPQARIVVIPKVLPGAVMTCMEGVAGIAAGEPVLFNDCDHLFLCQAFYDFCKEKRFDTAEGALLTFQSTDNRFSFVSLDARGYVCRTVEKQAVSQDAICGAYYFRNKEVFEKAAQVYLKSCAYSEFFMSGVYNVMADQGGKIESFRVDRHVSFGTPEEFEAAQKDETYRNLVE